MEDGKWARRSRQRCSFIAMRFTRSRLISRLSAFAMIKEVRLKFGSAPEGEVEKFGSTPVTIFVGPNNSGKSLILQELHRYCHTGAPSQKDLLIDGLVFDEMTPEMCMKKLEECQLPPLPDESILEEWAVVGKRGGRNNGQKAQLLR